jgi:hypothetical protein
MCCVLCHSVNEAQFHRGGDDPFQRSREYRQSRYSSIPKVSVCLDCGAAQFTTSESQAVDDTFPPEAEEDRRVLLGRPMD